MNAGKELNKIRNKKLTPEQRKDIARKAGLASKAIQVKYGWNYWKNKPNLIKKQLIKKEEIYVFKK